MTAVASRQRPEAAGLTGAGLLANRRNNSSKVVTRADRGRNNNSSRGRERTEAELAEWRGQNREDRRVLQLLHPGMSLGKCGFVGRGTKVKRRELETKGMSSEERARVEDAEDKRLAKLRETRRSGLRRGENGLYVSGANHCKNSNVCPVCAPVIRAGRADDIAKGVEYWWSQGGGVYMLTPTAPHKLETPAAETISFVTGAWSSLISGNKWSSESEETFERRYVKALMARKGGGVPNLTRRIGVTEIYGIEGFVKAFECTFGCNGCHPHLHVLLFTKEWLSAEYLEHLQAWFVEQWSGYVDAADLRDPQTGKQLHLNEDEGIQLEEVRTPGALGKYLTKIKYEVERRGEPEVNIGQEMVRGDLKSGRKGHRTQWQLLRDVRINDIENLLETGEVTMDILRLQEFVEACKGLRSIEWSHNGMYEKCHPGEQERTDDELMEEEEQGDEWVAEAEPVLVNAIVKRPKLQTALDEIVRRRLPIDETQGLILMELALWDIPVLRTKRLDPDGTEREYWIYDKPLMHDSGLRTKGVKFT